MNEITGLTLIRLSQLSLGWELARPVSSAEAGQGMLATSFPQITLLGTEGQMSSMGHKS